MGKLFYSIGQVLGITIIHSLWQGLLIYIVLRLLQIMIPSLSSVKKYSLSAFALVAIMLSFSCTFYIETRGYSWNMPGTNNSVPVVSASNSLSALQLSGDHPDMLNLTVHQDAFHNYKMTFYYAVKNYLPYISVLYAIGFLINLCGLAVAWKRIRFIKQSLVTASMLQQQITEFSKRLGIHKTIQVSFSKLIDVPCIIGYLKPILLLPVTISTQLSAEETEAILLHELSHIKNNDYLLNLLQQIITLLLFFNPFAQLINRAISRERENRCDDIVIQLTGKPLIYAHALLKLEETRHTDLKLALAATGKKHHLLKRIERIMKIKKPVGNIRQLILAVMLVAAGLIACLSFKPVSPTAFTFSGKITNAGGAYIRFTYSNEQEKMTVDIAPLKNGTFRFKGNTNRPGTALIYVYKGKAEKLIPEDNINATEFYLEPGDITATGSYGNIKKIRISGSKTQDEYQAYRLKFAAIARIADPIEARYLSVNREYIAASNQHKSTKVLDSLNKIAVAIRVQLSKYTPQYETIARQYIKDHPQSYISASGITLYRNKWPVDEIKNYYAKFSPAIQNSLVGREIQKQILARDNNAVGRPANNFTTTDINGKIVQLANFKGHYVLLDFWTSSEPILHDAPRLLRIYQKYHPKGLDIISVADNDLDPDTWKRAVKQNGTNRWHQVLRGLKQNESGFDTSNSIDDKFDVHACPTQILVDPAGTIIGRYVGGEEIAGLDKKLTKLFE